MSLAKRIIPTLLYDGAQLIKGRRFEGARVVGNVMQSARTHAARGVDELIMLDIKAGRANRAPNYDLVKTITDGMFTPVTVGGGVMTIKHVEELFAAGADKISVNRMWVQTPHIVAALARRYGAQAIVVSLDYRKGCEGVARHFAMRAEQQGVGEVLLTAMDREGTMEGYDINTIKTIASERSIPIIAHGGCSGPENMLDAIQAGASAVAAGALFQFTDHTPASCAAYLSKRGIEVRKP